MKRVATGDFMYFKIIFSDAFSIPLVFHTICEQRHMLSSPSVFVKMLSVFDGVRLMNLSMLVICKNIFTHLLFRHV